MIEQSNLKRVALVLAIAILTIFASASGLALAADGEADLAISLTAPQHVQADGTFVLNVRYSNEGSAASPENTWVTVHLPEGTEFVSATDRWGEALPPDQVDGNLLIWNVGSLPAGACCQHILITEQVASNLAVGSALENIAEIGSDPTETNLENNSASFTSLVCDMAGSTKQADVSEAMPGDVVTYTITLQMQQRNGKAGPGSREITLTDWLPPANQARFLGWISPERGTYNGNTLEWRGTLQPEDPIRLQYRLGIEGDVAPDTLVTNRAKIGWQGGEMEVEPVTVRVGWNENAHMFGPQGGQWQHSYGLTIEAPANTVPEMTRFQFKPLFEDQPPEPGIPGWTFARRAFELTAFRFGEVHQFGERLRLVLRYGEEDVRGLEQNTLRLWYRNGPEEPWRLLGAPVDQQAGQISFETDHFTQFALFGKTAEQVKNNTFQLFLPMLER